jgi:hypothetical protein
MNFSKGRKDGILSLSSGVERSKIPFAFQSIRYKDPLATRLVVP